jgi:hypothetical protein
VVSKLSAEFIGTFWLVLGGCGSAVLAAAFPGVGIGLLGVSLAFGLTVLSGAYALGPISGGHFNLKTALDVTPKRSQDGCLPSASGVAYSLTDLVTEHVRGCRHWHPRGTVAPHLQHLPEPSRDWGNPILPVLRMFGAENDLPAFK